jgi:PAS domain S-box-containing protein
MQKISPTPASKGRREDAFESSSELLAIRDSIFKHAIISRTDANGLITFANVAFQKISGYSEAELLGKSHKIVNSGQHPTEFFAEMWATLTEGRTWRGTICNRAKDGSLYWVDTTIAPVLCEEGVIKEFLSIRYDITQQVLSRRIRENQTKEYESILNGMREGFLLFDQNQQLVKFNQAAIEILGVDPNLLLCSLNCREGWQMIREDGSQFPQNEFPTAFSSTANAPNTNITIGLISPAGDTRWFLVNSIPFKFAETEKPGAFTTFSDISPQISRNKLLQQNEKKLLDRQKELSELNRRLEFVLEGANLGSWDWYLETNDVRFDRRWCEMLGMTLEETPQNLSTWETRVHPDDIASCFSDIKAHMEGKSPYYENTHRIRHSQGHWLWILDRGKVVEWNEKGEPIRFSGTHFDVTALKELEQQLKEAQVVAQIGNWAYRVDTNTSRWSDQMFEMFPTKSRVAPRNFTDQLGMVHPEDAGQWRDLMNRCLVDGSPYSVRCRINHEEKPLWVEIRGRGRVGEDGKVQEVYGTCQDITKQVTIEKENALIIDALKIGVWNWSVRDNSLSWNQRMFDLYDVSRDSFNHNFDSWESRLRDDDKERVVIELLESVEENREFDSTFALKDVGRGEKFIGARGLVVQDQEQHSKVMFGICWDRTKEMQLERTLTLERAKAVQNSKLASLGLMSAGVAHEINNPLAIIAGSIPLLSRFRETPERFNAKLSSIQGAVDRIAKIVNGLRKFSRSTDKKQFLPHSLKKIVDDAVSLSEVLRKRHNLGLKLEINTNARILCDEVEIEQVILNLIHNSVDAVKDQRSGWIKIRAWDSQEDTILQVLDSGPGISENIRSHLFDPFFTTKRVGEGTGLGLSIAKGILDEHHASIQLKDHTEGTCFEIRFKRHA